jgi:hypothetical protein
MTGGASRRCRLALTGRQTEARLTDPNQSHSPVTTGPEEIRKVEKPFRWTKAADEILDKMRRFGIRTQQVHRR